MAGRYTGDQYVVAGTLGTVSAHASYYLKTNPSTQVGVEVETNFRIGDSVATLAYQIDMPKVSVISVKSRISRLNFDRAFNQSFFPPFVMRDTLKESQHFANLPSREI